MTKVDLITGFLGAGKTTFIHRYLQYLRDQRVLIIENEFGSIGVDSSLLKDEGCPIEDLSGVCMCCKGRGRFISMLIGAAAHGYDRVLVEPSGIYDVDEFFSVMNEPAVRNCCEIGSILAIVDTHVPEDISNETGYLMVTQLLAAGAVILSKSQCEDPGAPQRTIAWLNELIRDYGGARTLGDEVYTADWNALTDRDFTRLMSCGHRHDPHRHKAIDHDETYESFFTGGYCKGEADLRQRLSEMITDPRYGHVLRVKGHLRDEDKNWYEINCTRREMSVAPAPNVRRGVLVFIGQDLNLEALSAAFPMKSR